MRAREEAGRGLMVLVVFLAAASLIILVAHGRATVIPGGGPTKTDCYMEFDVKGSVTPATKANKITCTDGDPTCDTDGLCDGTCTFSIRLCPNQTGLAGCTPHPPLTKVKVKPNGALTIPTDLSGSACGAFTSVAVSVKKKKNGTEKNS